MNAEDPDNDFAPAAGTVTKLVFPGGPGIRVDTHLYAGATIPPYYDSMIAKVIAFGDTREIAIARMERALRETLVEGVQTTIGLSLDILASPQFREGRYDIEFSPTSSRCDDVAPRSARTGIQALYSVVVGIASRRTPCARSSGKMPTANSGLRQRLTLGLSSTRKRPIAS